MELYKEFSFEQSARLSLTESKIAGIPFQLLPRATYPAAQIERSLVWQSQFFEEMDSRPLLSIFMHDERGAAKDVDWARALQSVAVQAYRHFEVIAALPQGHSELERISELFERFSISGRIYLTDAHSQVPEALATVQGECALVFDPFVLLHPHALLILAKELSVADADLIFCNEVVVSGTDQGVCYLRRNALERYDTLSYDQVGSFFCLSTAAVKEIVQSGALSDTPAALWGWLLSTWVFCQERTSKHLPLGLVVRKRDAAGELEQSTISSVDNIVASFLGSLGCSADSIEVLETESVVHARPRFSAKNASVQVVVPFHNKAELTVRCLKSLKQQDCLANLVISLVDNNSDQDELKRVQDAIEGLGLSSSASITSDRGYFNFARLNNRAVGQAETEFVLFLNNDVELSDAHVVSNLLSWTQLPGVDAVGGLLSYEDGRVQHGGINFSSIRPENVTGIEQYCFVAREVHAVSFAMALVRRAAYLQAGKLDEQVCPNGFGDALFCHHLKRRGSRIIYTPFASAIHRESASRGRMPEEMELYEMHRARLPIAALYDDMQATAQPTRLPLSEIEEVPLDALLSRVRRVGWLYNLGNFVAHKIIRFWPRR